jgi:hypothetical protein
MEYKKEILGWEFDGAAFTIKLPDSKYTDTCKLIKKLLQQKHASLNKYQKVAGKLQPNMCLMDYQEVKGFSAPSN